MKKYLWFFLGFFSFLEAEMTEDMAYDLFTKTGQKHLYAHLSSLSVKEKKSFLKDLSGISPKTYDTQKKCLEENFVLPPYLPLTISDYVTGEFFPIGEKAISEGKVACLFLAGGQGTRLGIDKPKGTFPITLIEKKSFFALFAEKLKAAEKKYQVTLPMAIMVSSTNEEETKNFFERHHYFGLKKEQVDFFTQGSLPYLDKEGNWFLEEKTKLAQGSDGNGGVFSYFVKSPIYKKYKQLGVEHINILPIDNPLADPFDAALIGYHIFKKNDVTLKTIEKLKEGQKMGVLALVDNQIRILEYSDLSRAEQDAKNADGSFSFRYLYTGLFCANLPFFEKADAYFPQMPLHKAWKKEKKMDAGEIIACKCERFIFDAFVVAKKISSYCFPKEVCFSPLKQKEGDGGIKEVQKDLLQLDRKIFSNITGSDPSTEAIELSQEFYYPTEELKEKWKGACSVSGYISP